MAVYGKIPILKKITLMFLAVTADGSSMVELKRQFEQADGDQNGLISPDEFNVIFKQAVGNDQIPLQSTAMLFDMLDTNGNGQIEFSEFKAAMIKTTFYLQENQLRKAFGFFDKDKSGYITHNELCTVFETFEDLFGMFSANDYAMLISQVDSNQDGKISFSEFVGLMT